MKQKEKELFKSLCSFQTHTFEESLLEAATPTVLGHLFFNRMQAVAYGTLKKHNLLGKVNREFRNCLKSAYMQNLEKNKSFFESVQYIEDILSSCQCKYALLKGAYLCNYYPDGFRTSNDIDLLVAPRDVTEIGNALMIAGFKQGNVRNDKFEPATRKEIIESKMLRGETVPYIKEINLLGMHFLEVDINFSLDYKPGDTAVLAQMLDNSTYEDLGEFGIHTLRRDDFFVHLCSHLYKEATALPWVEMGRDMTLYKYCDIYTLFNDASKEQCDFLFKRAEDLGMEKVCAFAVYQTSKLFEFNNTYLVGLAESVLDSDAAFIHTVVSPKEKKSYVYYEKDILERFFSDNRKSLLKELKI